MTAPLEGIRVVETASFVTAPYAAMMLGDLGADVIKVEGPPRGDQMRNFGHKINGLSVMFANANRNKRSVLLDLKEEEGRSLFLDLIGTADVYIQNMRPGVDEKLGLGDDLLAQTNPRLVRVAVSGFGPDGPLSHRPAFDSLLQAQSGLVSVQGDTVRTIVADKTTSMFVVQAVLAALLSRMTTGVGQRVDLAMLDVMLYTNFPDLMQRRTEIAGTDDVRERGRSPVIDTSDGQIVVAPVSGAQIGRMVEAAGHPEWKEELKAIRNPTQLADRMLDLVASVAHEGTTEDWIRIFDQADVPAAPVRTLDEHLDDPQVVHNENYFTFDHPHLGPIRQVRHPARFLSRTRAPRPVPLAGEHTEEVLAELPSRADGRSRDRYAPR